MRFYNYCCVCIWQQIHASDRDFMAASSLLAVGVDYSHISNASYTKVLFLLSRCMLLLIDKKFTEVHPLLTSANHHVENWQGSPHQKEYLKVYFLVLQVCHYLMAGQVRPIVYIASNLYKVKYIYVSLFIYSRFR